VAAHHLVFRCWIPAVPDTKFCVHWTCDEDTEQARPHHALFLTVYLDNKLVERGFLRPSDIKAGKYHPELEITGRYFRGENGDEPMELPFEFGETNQGMPSLHMCLEAPSS
jgi:hypothetical protein